MPATPRSSAAPATNVPLITVRTGWERLVTNACRAKLEHAIARWIAGCRWFAGKGRAIRSMRIIDGIAVPCPSGRAFITLIEVRRSRSSPETYVLPLAFIQGRECARVATAHPGLIIARFATLTPGARGIVCDASAVGGFANAMLIALRRGDTLSGDGSRITFLSPAPPAEWHGARRSLTPRLSSTEQSNTTIRFGRSLMLKFFRRPLPGSNPEIEIGRLLAARGFRNAPALLGAIEHHSGDGVTRTLAVLHRFVPGAMDGWDFTLAELTSFLCRARRHPSGRMPGIPAAHLQHARLLGRRTAELHLALASGSVGGEFAPAALSLASRKRIAATMRESTAATIALLANRAPALDTETRALVSALLAGKRKMLAAFTELATQPLTGALIRIHGDLHLGQTLVAGGDVLIIDFEGEPALPIEERRRKQSPFHDVAGMLRSFDYAANVALRRELGHLSPSSTDASRITACAERWTAAVSAAFLNAYLAKPGMKRILPESSAHRDALLRAHLIRKAIYEAAYEVQNRPAWLAVPLRGLLDLLGKNARINAPRRASERRTLPAGV